MDSSPPSRAKIQIAVDLTSQRSLVDIKTHLESYKDIKNVEVNLEKQTVLLETGRPTQEVVQFIEARGTKALVTGIGAPGEQVVNLGSAVAIMNEGSPETGVRGVIRLVQSSMDISVVDGTLDGLTPNSNHRLAIHEYGDISNGCNSCGDILDIMKGKSSKSTKLYGDLGEVQSDNTGRADFRMESERMKVWDIIGRSMVISSQLNNTSLLSRLACGVIARSAGLFENVKRICACDGSTLWDEQVFNRPKTDTNSEQ